MNKTRALQLQYCPSRMQHWLRLTLCSTQIPSDSTYLTLWHQEVAIICTYNDVQFKIYTRIIQNSSRRPLSSTSIDHNYDYPNKVAWFIPFCRRSGLSKKGLVLERPFIYNLLWHAVWCIERESLRWRSQASPGQILQSLASFPTVPAEQLSHL